MNQEEEDALLAEFSRRNQHRQTEIDMASIYKLALAFPRRIGELGRIEWTDIAPKRRTILITQGETPEEEGIPRSGRADLAAGLGAA